MKIDTNSLEWKTVEEFVNAEISSLREMNDSDLDTVETATIRGQILFAKKVLSLAKAPEKAIEIENTSYVD